MKTVHFFSLTGTVRLGLSVLMGALLLGELRAADFGRAFSSPQAAADALIAAANACDRDALRALFGSATDELVATDRVQATNEFHKFLDVLSQTNRLVAESATRYVMELGTDCWPFPIPIVKRGNQWFFDTAAGKEELLNRRIGRNELATLEAVRAYVVAQRDYAARDRDDDQVLEYAQKLLSSPGVKDGLYWSPDLDGELSPLGPLIAEAQDEGYVLSSKKQGAKPAPFHGYFFKILTRQGKHAPGGKYNYIVNGNMIGGFALVAWPANYGESGVMTFIVNQQGRVYQKDLGPHTATKAAGIKAYDPDPSWSVSRD